jgi:peptidoglycan/xylan/chitin deacetylase (PgdA/CDA1 family)
VKRRRRLAEAVIGLAMIPLTAVPIWLYVTRTDDGYLMYLRGRYALAAPGTPGLEAEQFRRALEARRRLREIHGVPVLVYHGIGKIGADSSEGRFVLTRERFAEQMASLRAAGYEPVTTEQLALYLSADPASDDIPEQEVLGLPAKPILVTFDDGRADAMIQADPILEDTGMRATMFVIGKPTESGGFYYEGADKLREHADSGRWDLQNHTYELHDYVETARGNVSALVQPEAGESVGLYARRVAGDLDRTQALVERLTGRRPVAFAYPFGDWGATAVPRVADALREVLEGRMQLAFDQDGQDVWRPALPGDDRLRLHRLEVANWSGTELLAVLEAGAARAADVYEERGLGYRYSELELQLARARTSCGEPSNAPIHERSDLRSERLVALTFNGGPSAYTAAVLDVLERYDVTATFFVRGSQVVGHEQLLRRMLVEGNEIANGTLDGIDLVSAGDAEVAEQIDDTSESIHNATGDDPCLVRPPFGRDAVRVASIAAERGLATALWSVDPVDYLANSGAEVAGHVLSRVEPGDVVVLHDGGDDRRGVTIDALPAIAEGLLAHGYRFVTVSELLAWEEAPPPCESCATPTKAQDDALLATRVTAVDGAAQSGSVSQAAVHPSGNPGQENAGSGGGTGDGRPAGGSGSGNFGGGAGSGEEAATAAPEPAPAANDPPAPAEPPGDGSGPDGGDSTSPAPPPSGGGTGGGDTGGGGSTSPAPPASGGGGGGSDGGGGNPGESSGGGASSDGGSGGDDAGSGTPPGHGGTPPGHGGTPPGQSGTASDQTSTPPGQDGTPPGQGGTPPGQGKD